MVAIAITLLTWGSIEPFTDLLSCNNLFTLYFALYLQQKEKIFLMFSGRHFS